MSYSSLLLTIGFVASFINGFFLNEGGKNPNGENNPSEKEVVEKLVIKMPNSRIKRAVVDKKVYFTQEMNTNDAVIQIYDRNGVEVGSCDFWNKIVHPLCSNITNKSRLVFAPSDNVWKIQATNTYKIDLTKLERAIPSMKFDFREAKVVQGLVNTIPNSRISRFDLNEVIYFTQEMSANDAVTNIYDRNGVEIGSCDFWTKKVHPLCRILKNREIVFVPTDNVWNLKAINKFKVVPNIDKK